MAIKITFQVKTEKDANIAELLGDFTNWEDKPIKMKKIIPGLFEISVKFRENKVYHYKYKVDKKWKEEMDDGSPADGTVPNPFGTRDYFIDIHQ